MCVLIYLIFDLLIHIEMVYFINFLFMFGGLNVSIYSYFFKLAANGYNAC